MTYLTQVRMQMINSVLLVSCAYPGRCVIQFLLDSCHCGAEVFEDKDQTQGSGVIAAFMFLTNDALLG